MYLKWITWKGHLMFLKYRNPLPSTERKYCTSVMCYMFKDLYMGRQCKSSTENYHVWKSINAWGREPHFSMSLHTCGPSQWVGQGLRRKLCPPPLLPHLHVPLCSTHLPCHVPCWSHMMAKEGGRAKTTCFLAGQSTSSLPSSCPKSIMTQGFCSCRPNGRSAAESARAVPNTTELNVKATQMTEAAVKTQ